MINIDFTRMKKSGSKPGEYNGICPFCGGSKFYINIYSKKYICFRASCSISGRLDESSEGIIYDKYSDNELERVIKEFSDDDQVDYSIDLDKFSMPLSRSKSPFAYNYMISRGFTNKDIEDLKLRVGIEYEENDRTVYRWKGRVIFPYYDNGIPLYAIGRSYTNKDPKYLNTTLSKSVILYNKEKIKDSVIVCEGLLSAISASKFSGKGIPAVPILGTYISDFQAYEVSKAKDIFISLDGGVNVENVIQKLNKYGRNLFMVSLPDGKDPDDLKEDYQKYFDCAKKIDGDLYVTL